MTIKLIKGPSYVAGQGLKLTGNGSGMRAGNVMSGGGGALASIAGDIYGDFYFTAISSNTQTDLAGWENLLPAVSISSGDEWSSPSTLMKYKLFQMSAMITGRNPTGYFRATIDGGTNWSNSSFDPALAELSPVVTGWAIDVRSLVKPGGGTISGDDVGSSYTLTIQSSADGSSWSTISSMALSIIS